jgi:hypothetical protein
MRRIQTSTTTTSSFLTPLGRVPSVYHRHRHQHPTASAGDAYAELNPQPTPRPTDVNTLFNEASSRKARAKRATSVLMLCLILIRYEIAEKQWASLVLHVQGDEPLWTNERATSCLLM